MANKTRAQLKRLVDGSDAPNKLFTSLIDSMKNTADDIVTNGVGTVGAATVVAEESGDGVNHVTTLTLTDFIIGALAGAAAALTLTPVTALYTLPAGAQLKIAAYASIGSVATGTAVTPELGLGTTAGAGSVDATLGAAGAGTENILTGYNVADTVTGAAVEGSNVTPAAIGAAADKAIYLNAAGTWNADNTGNLVANGTIVLVWTSLV